MVLLWDCYMLSTFPTSRKENQMSDIKFTKIIVREMSVGSIPLDDNPRLIVSDEMTLWDALPEEITMADARQTADAIVNHGFAWIDRGNNNKPDKLLSLVAVLNPTAE